MLSALSRSLLSSVARASTCRCSSSAATSPPQRRSRAGNSANAAKDELNYCPSTSTTRQTSCVTAAGSRRTFSATPRQFSSEPPVTPPSSGASEGEREVVADRHPDTEKEPLPEWPEGVNPGTGERGGPRGPEPTRYGDWERKGRVSDF